MSLKKQARAAYTNQTRLSNMNVPKKEKSPTSGLMNRNKDVKPADESDDPNDKSAYLMEQFKYLQKKRTELNNG
tara:strand:- start:2875 stop:3096 length:222 start_codon:yes stop_codon:yes gene_type:complete